MPPDSGKVRQTFLLLQESLRERLEESDSALCAQEDEWTRQEGGGGRTWAFHSGRFLEKGGINFSDVQGMQLPPTATQNRPELAGVSFHAMGVSVVLHPDNPHIPTSHANIRYFEATPPGKDKVWWFGGGFDLTPYYPIREDVIDWHKAAKKACDESGAGQYLRFKKWCDDYFYLPHRQEPRGVGGLFYDDLNEWGFDQTFAFMRSVGDGFLSAYVPILERRKDAPWTEAQRQWQLYRRGRYVEFNLVHDRGTLFGLQTNGRTEAILMSLPPLVRWEYGYSPDEGSPEATLMTDFLRPRDWLGLETAADSR